MNRLRIPLLIGLSLVLNAPTTANATKWKARQKTASKLLQRAQVVTQKQTVTKQELVAQRGLLITALNTMRYGGLTNKKATKKGTPLINALRRTLISNLVKLPMEPAHLPGYKLVSTALTYKSLRRDVDDSGTMTLGFERDGNSEVRTHVVAPLDIRWSHTFGTMLERSINFEFGPPKYSIPYDIFYPEKKAKKKR